MRIPLGQNETDCNVRNRGTASGLRGVGEVVRGVLGGWQPADIGQFIIARSPSNAQGTAGKVFFSGDLLVPDVSEQTCTLLEADRARQQVSKCCVELRKGVILSTISLNSYASSPELLVARVRVNLVAHRRMR